MAGEVSNFVNDLPAWAQTAANVGIFVVTVGGGAFAYFMQKKSPKPETKEVVVENGKNMPGVDKLAVEYMLFHDMHETLKDIKEMIEEELKERNIEREVLKRIGHSLPPSGTYQQPSPMQPPIK